MSKSNKALELLAITDWEMRGKNAGWRVKALGIDCGVSPRTLERFWKEERQVPLAKWLVEQRFALACHLLRTTDQTIEEVGNLVAYRHIGGFSHAFNVRYGMPPSKWRIVFGPNQGPGAPMEQDAELVSWAKLQPRRFDARS